jgi:uridine kinase
MIGIAGGSCSGKTRLANAIVASLPSGIAVAIGLDSYYLDQPPTNMESLNFDDPEALEKNLMVKQIRMLSQGVTIRKPVYDYVNHRRSVEIESIQPMRFIIVEGLYTFYWKEIRNFLAIKVFIELDHEACLERRIARDTMERGRTPDSIVRQYLDTVRPMFERCIHPTKKYADLLLDGSDSIDSLAAIVCKRLPE